MKGEGKRGRWRIVVGNELEGEGTVTREAGMWVDSHTVSGSMKKGRSCDTKKETAEKQERRENKVGMCLPLTSCAAGSLAHPISYLGNWLALTGYSKKKKK